MSYSDSFPTQRPIFTLDAANAGRLDPRISYSRNTTGTYFGTAKHESSQNLITNSENFSAWTTTNTSVTANAIAAPDGTTTADTITGTGTGSIQKAVQNDIPAADYPVVSVYVKAGTHNLVQIQSNWSGSHYANFDVTSGAGAVGSLGSNTTATIEAVGSTGWYRCVCRFNAASMSPTIIIRLVDSTSAGYGASTTSTGTVHLWGAMATDIGDLTNIVAYQPSTTQIHREYAPTLQTAAINAPRFEFSATDSASAAMGESLGLLVEGQAQNLIPYSSAINSWVTKGNVTITDGAAIGPDGTLSASLVRPTGATSLQHYIRENITTVASSSYTFSAYVKPAGYTKLLLVGEQTAYPYTDYANATFTLTGAGSVTTAAGSATITALSDGWYRVTATGTAATTSSYALMSVLNNAGDAVYTADSYSGIIITAVQFEQNSFQSSYIATSGSAVTRASDSASITSSSLFDNGQGAVVVDASASGYNFGRFFALSDGGSNDNSIQMFAQSTTQVASDWRVGGTTVRQMSKSGLPTLSGGNKAAVSWETNQLRQAFNGTETNTYTTYPAAPLTKLDIGCWGSGNQANGHCKRIAVYGEPLSQTELESLTS